MKISKAVCPQIQRCRIHGVSYLLAPGLLMMSVVAITPAQAQCVNTATPSCQVYEICFAKYCPCQGDDDYFLKYGKKYCEAFLGSANFSDAGKKWRARTLTCLQEKIVPKLDISDNPSCNCGEMKSFAFDAHVSCYTQQGASICDLGADDVLEITRIIELGDALTADGLKQSKKVAEICSTKAPDAVRRGLWAAIASLIPA